MLHYTYGQRAALILVGLERERAKTTKEKSNVKLIKLVENEVCMGYVSISIEQNIV